MADWLGVHHPPDRISLWASYGEVTPLSFLREVPGLTHLHPLPATARESERSSNAATPMTDPIAGRRAWEYMTRRSYGNNSYNRTAASLRTVEGYVGEPTMVRIMRTYCQRYRFQHPEPRDFFDVAVEVAKNDGKGDIRWLLTALFESEQTFDFGIESLDVKPLPRLGPEPKAGEAAPESGRQKPDFESLVVVRRYGGVHMPIDVRVRFDDGSVRDFLWERDDSVREYAVSPVENSVLRGELRAEPLGAYDNALNRVTAQRPEQALWVKLRFRGPAKALSAEVDPYSAYALDADRTNDGRASERNAGASIQLGLRALGWVQMSTSFYGGL